MDKATKPIIFLNIFELSFCIITTILVIIYRNDTQYEENLGKET